MKYFVIENYLNHDSEKIIDLLLKDNANFKVFSEKLSFKLIKRYFKIYIKTFNIFLTLLIIFKIIIKNTIKNFIFKSRIKKYEYMDDINSSKFLDICKKEKFKFGLLLNSPLINEKIIETLNIPILNIHIGALPKYRNKYSNIKAMIENNNPAITIHLIDKYIDGGEILSVVHLPYLPHQNMIILDLLITNLRKSTFVTFKNKFKKNISYHSQKFDRDQSQLQFLLPTKKNLEIIEKKKIAEQFSKKIQVKGIFKEEIKDNFSKLIEPYYNFLNIYTYFEKLDMQSWWGTFNDVRFLMLKLLQRKKNKIILDVGGGIGSMSNSINISNNNEIYSLDIDKDKVHIAKKNSFLNTKSQYVQHDLNQDFPYCNEKFDIIFLANNVPGFDFEKLKTNRDLNFYNELYRVLKPKGKIYLSTPNGESDLYLNKGKATMEILESNLKKFTIKKFYWGECKNIFIYKLLNYFVTKYRNSILSRYFVNKYFYKKLKTLKKNNNKIFYFLILKKNF